MEGFFWKALLLVGALSASGLSAPSQKLLTYDEAVEQAVANYNSKAKEATLYQLLDAVPQPDWDPNSEGPQDFKFTIKETVCPAEEEGSLDQCDFKEDGVVRECTATYFLGEKPPVAFLDCNAVQGVEEEEKEVEEKEEETENQEEEEKEEEEDPLDRSSVRYKPPKKSSKKEVKVSVRLEVQKNKKITFVVTVTTK